jgi:hypothetical protein
MVKPTKPTKGPINSPDEARDAAINWQSWMSDQTMSWGEVTEWEAYFSWLAARFPELTDEFVENGIIADHPSTKKGDTP